MTTGRNALRSVAHAVGMACGIGTHASQQFTELSELLGEEAVTTNYDTTTIFLSAINGTGLPLQFSIALGDDSPSARVLGEAGTTAPSMTARLRRNGQLCVLVLQRLGLDTHVGAIDRILALLLPRSAAQMQGWTGALWCGAVVTSDGEASLRVYLNQRWGTRTECIDRLSAAIHAVAGEEALASWLRAAAGSSDDLAPYGVALDIGRRGVARIKVYAAARTSTLHSIAAYIRDAVPQADLSSAQHLLTACESLGGWVRPWQVMPCLEFARASTVRGKVDVALCTLPSTDVAVDRMLRCTMSALELADERYDAFVSAVSPTGLHPSRVQRLQYASVGVRPDRHDLTVYASPTLDHDSMTGSDCTSAWRTCAVV